MEHDSVFPRMDELIDYFEPVVRERLEPLCNLAITVIRPLRCAIRLPKRVCRVARYTASAMCHSWFNALLLVLSILEGLFVLVYAIVEWTCSALAGCLFGDALDQHKPRTVIYAEVDLPPMNDDLREHPDEDLLEDEDGYEREGVKRIVRFA